MRLTPKYLYCLMASLILCCTSGNAQSNETLSKQIIGTWIVQGMNIKMNLDSLDETTKKVLEEQKPMLEMSFKGASERMKETIAFIFEKGGKFTSINTDVFPEKEAKKEPKGNTSKKNKGTWTLDGNKLILTSDDKSTLQEFQNLTALIVDGRLHLTLGAPKNAPSNPTPMSMVMEFKKGAVKELKYKMKSGTKKE